MDMYMDYVILLGRILFAQMFIISGLNHFTKLNGMAQYAGSMGLPAPKFSVLVTGIMILLGGVSVLLGFYAKIGALLLLIFLLPTAFVMHKFWGLNDQMLTANQKAHFMKNLAMAGGALFIIYIGSGPLSLKP